MDEIVFGPPAPAHRCAVCRELIYQCMGHWRHVPLKADDDHDVEHIYD